MICRLDSDVKKESNGGGSGLSLPDSQVLKNPQNISTISSHQAQEGGSADLLGLGVPSAAGTNGAVNGAATVTNNIAKFHCKSNGVLYENEILQVLYKV